eukprot:766425-Hanusia_phi.AAC.4
MGKRRFAFQRSDRCKDPALITGEAVCLDGGVSGLPGLTDSWPSFAVLSPHVVMCLSATDSRVETTECDTLSER